MSCFSLAFPRGILVLPFINEIALLNNLIPVSLCMAWPLTHLVLSAVYHGFQLCYFYAPFPPLNLCLSFHSRHKSLWLGKLPLYKTKFNFYLMTQHRCLRPWASLSASTRGSTSWAGYPWHDRGGHGGEANPESNVNIRSLKTQP